MTEDDQVLRALPVVESTDILRRTLAGGDGEVIRGTMEFHNFEPIVQMMALMSEAVGERLSDEAWDDLCTSVQVDPEEQRRFRLALRAELGEE